MTVPNVSEGRDLATLEAIGRAFAPARFLDLHTDPDHDRAVFTLAARQGEMAEALLGGARSAVARIDISAHTGIHPHVGALDVMPIVYLDEERRGAAIAETLAAAGLIGEELGVPVFLYGELATRPEHAERAWIRKGGPKELARRIQSGELVPDYGPARPHPSAGAILAAARPPLVAFNVDLVTDDLAVAKQIAAGLRESGGGMPGVRALGLYLHERNRAQVSTNVHDHRAAPLREIVEYVRARAEVAEAELIGLAPSPRGGSPGGGLGRPVTSPVMAQTKRKRTRKHRGTPAGTIERAGRTGRPQTREDAKQIARQRRQERLDKPPTWKGAVNRAAIAAAVFGVLVILAFGRSVPEGVVLAGFMFLLYIPLGYVTDQGIYRFRQRKKAGSG
jgi:glutamate formiminotransferase/glutamate formiminotransferase/formiminotetrahydrofolate cyclodeaminase